MTAREENKHHLAIDWKDVQYRAWEEQITARLNSELEIIDKMLEHRRQSALDTVMAYLFDELLKRMSSRICPKDDNPKSPFPGGQPCSFMKNLGRCTFTIMCIRENFHIRREIRRMASDAIENFPPGLSDDYEVEIDMAGFGDLVVWIDNYKGRQQSR